MHRPPRRPWSARTARTAVAACAAAVVAAAAWSADAGPRERREPLDPAFPDLSDVFAGPYVRWGSDPLATAATVAEGGSARVVIGPFPEVVHLDAVRGTAVRVVLARAGGAAPEILWVQDGEGRAWTPAVTASSGRLTTEEIPVEADGGLDVVLTPTRTPVTRVRVSYETRAAVPGEERVPSSPWAPGTLVADASDLDLVRAFASEQGLVVWVDAGGFLVLGTPGERAGLEWADAEALNALFGDGSPFAPDAYAEPPEGSQSNQLVVGSEFGRAYPRQPALRLMHAAPPGLGPDGAGVTIAVLDTGVDATHPVFAGRVLPGRDFVDDDDDASETRDEVDGDGDGVVDDGFGHGTVVAGIALAVAPQARILPVRVLDDEGLGTASRVAQGVRWAVANGAHVVNLSLGTRAWSHVLDVAVREAVEAGVMVCVAAGNRGDRWTVDFPSDVAGVIAVTALGPRGRLAGFANGRRSTTVAALGIRVVGPYPGATWALGTGTSFSAPLASGAAALLRQERADANAAIFRAVVAPLFRLDLRPLWR